MNFGILISLGLHATALLGGLLLFKGDVKPFEDTKIIPIEMVTIEELTNIKAAIKPPKPVKKPEPEPDVMTVETPTKNAEAEGERQERVEEVVEEPVKVAEVVPDIVDELSAPGHEVHLDPLQNLTLTDIEEFLIKIHTAKSGTSSLLISVFLRSSLISS